MIRGQGQETSHVLSPCLDNMNKAGRSGLRKGTGMYLKEGYHLYLDLMIGSKLRAALILKFPPARSLRLRLRVWTVNVVCLCV